LYVNNTRLSQACMLTFYSKFEIGMSYKLQIYWTLSARHE